MNFGVHLLSVNCNDKNNARSGLLLCITIRKVVLLDILSQMVQKLGFIIRQRPSWQPSWWPSWISQLAQGYPLAFRCDIHYGGPNDSKSTVILNTNHVNSYKKVVSLDILVSIFKIDVFCEMTAILAAILKLCTLITN